MTSRHVRGWVECEHVTGDVIKSPLHNPSHLPHLCKVKNACCVNAYERQTCAGEALAARSDGGNRLRGSAAPLPRATRLPQRRRALVFRV
ncbi:unnamed protein product [Arctia plantaginis]|uniref:Uncharacterized protein n=1 Tax=Arctia plantaginis TaxID=874455 RepID=A0A8S1AU55_ARCPL|nr:unnamed protein product [Arctia plantaginis]